MLFKRENYQIKSNSIGFYQNLEHLDGIGISAVPANLYKDKKRDEVVIFYFRKGATHATVYTQSNIKSENIKWNLNNSKDKIYALLVNTRNANAFTGKEGYKSINNIASLLADTLSKKQSLTKNHCYIPFFDDMVQRIISLFFFPYTKTKVLYSSLTSIVSIYLAL